MIQLDGGAWQSWNGTDDLGLGTGTLGVPTPYSIKVATGGTTTLSQSNMTALKNSISALIDNSRIALDLSAAKIATGVLLSNLTYYLVELHSFVFPENNANITDLSLAFNNCTNLVSVSAIPSSVTTMESTFQVCHNFNQAITIPNSVTSMYRTFYGCTSFNESVTFSSPSSVTDMSYTFYQCTNFNKAIDIPSSVTDMGSTFYGCAALASTITINIAAGKTISAVGYVDTDKVDIYQMFDWTTTSNIDLKVTSEYLGTGGNQWYSVGGTALTDGSWTFKSVTGIPLP